MTGPGPAALRLDRLGHELRPGEQRLPRLPSIVVAAVSVGRDKLHRRPDAVHVVTVAIAPVSSTGQAIDRYGLRLDLDGLPAVVHQQLLGVPGLGERGLHRLGIGVLPVAADRLAGQGHHQVVAIVAVCGQPVLRQFALDGKGALRCSWFIVENLGKDLAGVIVREASGFG